MPIAYAVRDTRDLREVRLKALLCMAHSFFALAALFVIPIAGIAFQEIWPSAWSASNPLLFYLGTLAAGAALAWATRPRGVIPPRGSPQSSPQQVLEALEKLGKEESYFSVARVGETQVNVTWNRATLVDL